MTVIHLNELEEQKMIFKFDYLKSIFYSSDKVKSNGAYHHLILAKILIIVS